MRHVRGSYDYDFCLSKVQNLQGTSKGARKRHNQPGCRMLEVSEVKRAASHRPYSGGKLKVEQMKRETDRLVNEEILGVVDLEALVLNSSICQISGLLGDICLVVHAIERFA